MDGPGERTLRNYALTLTVGGRPYRVHLDRPQSLAIPLDFHGAQPNLYDVPPAEAHAYTDGAFVGDTRRGGGCNFEVVRLIPHCHGTHTECVGHIAHARIAVHDTLRHTLMPATLASVTPTDAGATDETYVPPLAPADRLITRAVLHAALAPCDDAFLEALVLRTHPNPPGKAYRRYAEAAAPFFTHEAIRYLDDRQVQHLLIDLPSVDRAFDEGRLSVHHLFWQVPQGSHDVDPAEHTMRTITELIYVPDALADGVYLLNLQIPAFQSDAAPSRPLLYPISQLDQPRMLSNRTDAATP